MVQWRRHFRSEAHVISHEIFQDTQDFYHFSFFSTHAPVVVRVVTHVVIVGDIRTGLDTVLRWREPSSSTGVLFRPSHDVHPLALQDPMV
jgi:hypothetical protein